MYIHERNHGCRISDEWTYRGLRAVVLENRWLRVTVLADKGTDCIEFLHKPTDTDFMWRSPIGVRSPALQVPTGIRSDGFFGDYYHGGWQEILPNGGPGVRYKGAELGQHGEVALSPWRWSVEDDRPERVAVRFWVRTYRTPFYLEKRLVLEQDRPVLDIEERLVNESPEPMELMWGHHPCFGPPFVAAGCRLDLPPCTVVTTPGIKPTSRLQPDYTGPWPYVPLRAGGLADLRQIPGPDTGSADLTYVTDLAEGWYALTNPHRRVGFGLAWDAKVFRHLWLWQVWGGFTGAPWYSRTYNLAVEPFTSFPTGLDKAIEAGRALVLPRHGEVATTLRAVAYEGLTGVRSIAADGTVLAGEGGSE